MPIQFENTFVNPNIQVKGAEIPLEQLEKTSNILRDKYDKSYENLTKFQVLAKQAEQMADPLEREKVKEYIASYQPAIDQMVKDDALHRVGWQTMAMANEAAGNLKTFQDRAAEIKTIKDKLATLDINDTVNREYYQNMLDQATKQTAFDPNKRSFDFKPINVPNFVKDYDYAKFLFDASGNWRPDIISSSNKNVIVKQAQYDAAGNLVTPGGIYDKATGYKVSEVKEKEVRENILKALKGSPGAMEALDRDVNAKMWKMGLDANDPKNAATKSQIRDEVYNTKVLGVAQAAAQKEANRQVLENSNEETYNKDLSALFFGNTSDDDVEADSKRQSQAFKPNESSTISAFSEGIKNLSGALAPGASSGSGANDAQAVRFQTDPKNKYLTRLLVNSLSDLDYLKELKKSNPEAYTALTSSEIEKGTGKSTNIYDLQNTMAKGQPLNVMQLKFLGSLIDNQNVTLPSAYIVRNRNDKSYQKEMIATYGAEVTTQGSYDAKKAKEHVNDILFENPNGLVIKKDTDGTLKGTNYGAASGLLIMDPDTGEIKPFTTYMDEHKESLPDETTINITGKVEPGSLKHANSNNPWAGNDSKVAKSFGNSYSIDVNGKTLLVANPLDATSKNATISELAKFTEGVNPIETIPIYENKRVLGELEVESGGGKVHVKGMGINKIMTTEAYKNWIKNELWQRK